MSYRICRRVEFTPLHPFLFTSGRMWSCPVSTISAGRAIFLPQLLNITIHIDIYVESRGGQVSFILIPESYAPLLISYVV